MGLTVEELIALLNDMIKNKPITNKMEFFIKEKDGSFRAITEVLTQREQNGKPVRTFLLLE